MNIKSLSYILTAIVIACFYIVYVPCAIIKDALSLFVIPFDMPRMWRCMVNVRRNLEEALEFGTTGELPDDGKQAQKPFRTTVTGFSAPEQQEEEGVDDKTE